MLALPLIFDDFFEANALPLVALGGRTKTVITLVEALHGSSKYRELDACRIDCSKGCSCDNCVGSVVAGGTCALPHLKVMTVLMVYQLKGQVATSMYPKTFLFSGYVKPIRAIFGDPSSFRDLKS